ncbi:hypothetical protein PR202_ga22797 [Eleusine coracana subsp. coracana]|uniref:RHOMBOID-like protein n=1 Tax=Eleusine coracana subsp. coracana TaxID=191504 RepID=A0AAV5D2M2_ELECO|nr:hypothetical protein PR202_ga22797 [Eleusine coracana subsp. coracana]
MKPLPRREEDVEILVERPYSHEGPPPHPPIPPVLPRNSSGSRRPLRARPYYRRWSPWIVSAATVACIAVFVVTMYVNDCPRHRSAVGGCTVTFLGRFAFQPIKENPLLGPSSATTIEQAIALSTQYARTISLPYQMVITPIVDLDRISSPVVLYRFLVMKEIWTSWFQCFILLSARDAVRIGLVYLISGFGGSLMSALFIQSTTVSVGASGALFGLIGSMLSELITNWSLYANKVAALVILILVIVLNLGLGLLPRVDNFAHIGGLISGFLLGFVFFIRPQFAWLNQRRESDGQQTSPVKRKHKTYQYILWVAAAVLLIVGFTVAIVLLFRGYNANEHCSWCKYLSCVPTKRWKCNSSSSSTLCSVIKNCLIILKTKQRISLERQYNC